jgi:hypothetical protein
MEPKQVLMEARALIADPIAWVQELSAGVRLGDKVIPAAQLKANCWCAAGAVEEVCDGQGGDYDESCERLDAAADEEFGEELHEIRAPFLPGLHPRSFILVNDHIGHDAILHVFDIAIKRAS